MCKGQCSIMAHICVIYGSWVWAEESLWPPWASGVSATFWTSPLHEGLRADGRHISVKLGDTA